MNCRHCGAETSLTLIDLGSAPLSNGYLTQASLRQPEPWLPLKVLICESCWLVQTEAYASAAELFNADYAYFSSFSDQWLRHAECYVTAMVDRFGIHAGSRVVEIASNDGYLLQYVKQRGIPCLGIEPTASTAAAARLKGIETLEAFFDASMAGKLAAQGGAADLIAANNVLAHVPNINDFVKGCGILLKPHGVVTFEFPHLMNLIELRQFDTIYHEHFSYFSFSVVVRILAANGLDVFDVETLVTHGGSLRVFAQRKDAGRQPVGPAVAKLLKREADAGMTTAGYYADFQAKADKIKDDLVAFLIDAKRQGRTVAAYGAAAKGNTLLNYAGVRADLLPFVADRNPAKQGKNLPGSRIPIVSEAHIRSRCPDHVLLLPWNLRQELMAQLGYIREWGGQFVVAVPNLEVT